MQITLTRWDLGTSKFLSFPSEKTQIFSFLVQTPPPPKKNHKNLLNIFPKISRNLSKFSKIPPNPSIFQKIVNIQKFAKNQFAGRSKNPKHKNSSPNPSILPRHWEHDPLNLRLSRVLFGTFGASITSPPRCIEIITLYLD